MESALRKFRQQVKNNRSNHEEIGSVKYFSCRFCGLFNLNVMRYTKFNWMGKISIARRRGNINQDAFIKRACRKINSNFSKVC